MKWISKIKPAAGKAPAAPARAPVKSKPVAQKAAPPSQPSTPAKEKAVASKPPVDATDRERLQLLAKALFRVMSDDQKLFSSREEFTKAWSESRKKYLGLARKLQRNLERQGINLIDSPQ